MSQPGSGPAGLRIEKTSQPRPRPDEKELGFGRYFTDHMFIMDYTDGQGWHDPRIVAYGAMPFEPATMVFHYGQAVFEGLKAYTADDGRILLFRPFKNMERINLSNDRLCIPPVDEKQAVDFMKQLILLDRDWIPTAEGTSLYIRPFIIATDPYLGVRPSHTYLFMIILSPVGNYYAEGLNPVRILVETEYVRAVRGGTGYVKTPGNYAASIKAQEVAHRKGYTQVLWLDGVERKYIEEVGTMNVFFVLGDEVVTPSLEGSILDGITRDSAITLLKHWGLKVTERRLSIDELASSAESGRLKEAFGTGTAAVISPIGELNWMDKRYSVHEGRIGPLSKRLYDTITALQNGRLADEFHWVETVG